MCITIIHGYNKLGEEHQLTEVLHCILAKDLSAFINALVTSSSSVLENEEFTVALLFSLF